MKKTLLAGLVAGLMMLGAVGVASATQFTSTTNINEYLSGTGTKTWTQAMPTDFQMPYDLINSAKLTIFSNFVGGSNDKVTVENTYMGTLKNDTGFKWICWLPVNPMESTDFDIKAGITSPWSTGQVLEVSLAYDEKTWCLDSLFLQKSVLCLDYKDDVAPVPEPGTMMLLGMGMLGLAVYGKRRMNKQA